jgi:SAM-dependent methyltransferase
MMGIFRKFLRHIDKGILFNPVWISERRLRSQIEAAIGATGLSPSESWLDVGCGLRPYESCFPAGSYVGVDIEVSGRDAGLKAPDHYYDGRTLPFSAGNFDGIISTQVLEHVPDPHGLLAEMHRVIKPGGTLIISLPFVWQEHEEPYDFFRFTRFGIADLLKRTGFEVDSIAKDTGAIETLAMTLNVYITHNLVPPVRGFGRLVIAAVCFPVQLVAMVLQGMLPDQRQLYLNLVIRAKKPAHTSRTQ